MTPYTYIWEFEVRPGCEAEFELHYGPNGSWVNLFRRARGYLDTTLLHDRAESQRYVTVDRWESEGAYREFRTQQGDAFTELDSRCEALTLAEREIGHFDTVDT